MKSAKYILNSYNRYSGTNNNPTFNFNQIIKASSVYVNRVNIPHTFYNIVEDINDRIIWVPSVGTDEISTFIPGGNYSIDELLTEIGVKMTADAIGEDDLTYTATKDDNTGKITITNNTAATFTINANTNDFPIAQDEPAAGYLLYQLGFFVPPTFGTDVAAVTILSGAGSYTGSSSYYISPQNLYIESSLVKESTNNQAFAFYNVCEQHHFTYTTFLGLNNVLLNIPIVTQYGDQIIYEAGNIPEKLLLNYDNAISSIDFTLKDSATNLPLDLNGRSWTIELVFEY